MISVDQIRKRLKTVIDGKMDIDAFDEWITRESWNMHLDSPREAVDLVGKIELMLAEFDGGRSSEAELRMAFEILSYVVEFDGGAVCVYATSAAPATVQSFSFQSELMAGGDKQRGAVSSYIPLLQLQ